MLFSRVFDTIESAGDPSKDSSDGRLCDLRMTALFSIIEIDLRDMLNETELPEPVMPKDNTLY